MVEGAAQVDPTTNRRYIVSSRALLVHFRDIPLDRITPEGVEGFKTRRTTQKGKRTGRLLRPATVNRELACLKAMFNFAIKGDIVLKNPVARVRFLPEDNEQMRVLTFTEQQQYLAAAPPALHDIAVLMLEPACVPTRSTESKRTVFTWRAGTCSIPSARQKRLAGRFL